MRRQANHSAHRPFGPASRLPSALRLAAAAVALPLAIASSARAQYRVGSDGHARDANNQVGGGGINGGDANQSGANVSGNQIVNGDVTGGAQFRGARAFTAASAFRARLPGEGIDAFVRDSTGVPGGTYVPPAFTGPRVYYPQSITVAPPPGLTQQPYVGGYVPAVPNVPASEDLRLGVPLGEPQAILPKPGELDLPGQVDPTADANNVYTTASPLYGVRQWQIGNGLFTNGTSTNADAMGHSGLSSEQVMQMRRELGGTLLPNDNGSNAANPSSGDASRSNGAPAGTDQPLNNAVAPLQIASNAPLAPLAAGARPGDVSTGQGLRQTLAPVALPPPTQQSAQYAELRRRLAQYDASHPQTDEQANREYQQALAARKILLGQAPTAPGEPPAAAGAAGTPGATPDLSNPGAPAVAGNNLSLPPNAARPNSSTPDRPADAPKPYHIDSIANGVKAPGLRELLVEGESLMKQQKFAAAKDNFDRAQQVAPNNPLIVVSRANAELGGSFYTAAAGDLRDAFQTDKALLLGQYDLQGLIGTDRLQYVVKDLKDIATQSPDNPTPIFLLAYIAYNTGNEAKAGGYLQIAQKRANGTDPLLDDLQHYWTTGGDTTTQPSGSVDMNK